jgi:hypothetical protein
MPDEEPEVLVLRPSDLRLVPPAAIIRCLDDPSLWTPTVEGTSTEGPVVGLLAHPVELTGDGRRVRGAAAPVPPPSAPDITALLRYIGSEMRVRGRLASPWALYATDVRPEIWARTEELTEATGHALTARLESGEALEVPVRQTAAGEAVGALRDRGIAVFLTGDHDSLAAAIGRYLVGCGFLRDPRDLRARPVREVGPERLDPDSIWSGRTPDFAAEPAEELETTEQTHLDREVETT